MSNDSNENVELQEITLEQFEQEFFQKEAPQEPEAKVEDEVDETIEETDTLAPETDEDADDEEADEQEEEAVDEPPAKPEKPKSRAQERIEELNAKYREQERTSNELANKLAEAIAKLDALSKPAEQPKTVAPAKNTGPTPDDKTEDGSDKYPLGEYDPAYIRDLTRYTLAEQLAEQKAALAEQEARESEQEARNELTHGWNERLESSKEKYPDFHEKNLSLQRELAGIDPQFGDYLALTIMSMDHGEDVLYHLASNPAEAKAITKMNAAKATLALGRLEARFADQKQEQKRLKVSKAPTPPERLNKGTLTVKPDVADDTDDLEAFSKKFFKKR